MVLSLIYMKLITPSLEVETCGLNFPVLLLKTPSEVCVLERG